MAAPGSGRGGAGALDLNQLLVDAGAGLIDRCAKFVEGLDRSGLAMLLQPEPLAQHFLQRGADALVLIAGDSLDFGFRCAQPGFERVRGIQ